MEATKDIAGAEFTKKASNLRFSWHLRACLTPRHRVVKTTKSDPRSGIVNPATAK